MKRVVKFYQTIGDETTFSNCSTNYEILPVLLEDTTNNKDLIDIANVYSLERIGYVRQNKNDVITHFVKLDETVVIGTSWKPEVKQVYLGLYDISRFEKGTLKPEPSIDNKITSEQIYDIINNQEYGVNDVGATVDNETVLVKSGWNYYHEIRLLGYSLESFEKQAGITEEGFDDDTYRCSKCGLYNSHSYFRFVDCECIGVECGCYDEYCKDNIDEFINNPKKCMELDVAEELEEEGKIKHVERFISGMTDGRGGYFAGQSTREGRPKSVIKELLQSNKKGKYLFTHDESGQFQMYFSVWEVL